MLSNLPIIITFALSHVFASSYDVSEPLYQDQPIAVEPEIKEPPQISWAEKLFLLPPLDVVLYTEHLLQEHRPATATRLDGIYQQANTNFLTEPDPSTETSGSILPPFHAMVNPLPLTETPPMESASLFSQILGTYYSEFYEVPEIASGEVALPQNAQLKEPSPSAQPQSVPTYERILELTETIGKIERIRMEHQAQIANIRQFFPKSSQMFDDGLMEMEFIFNSVIAPFQNELVKSMSERYGYDIPAPRVDFSPEPQPDAEIIQAIVLTEQKSTAMPASQPSRKRTNPSRKSSGPNKKQRGSY